MPNLIIAYLLLHLSIQLYQLGSSEMKSQKRITKSNRKHGNQDNRNPCIKKAKSVNKNKNQSKNSCSLNCGQHLLSIKKIPDQKLVYKGIAVPLHLNFCSTTTGLTLPTIFQSFSNQPQIPLFLNNEDIQKYQAFLKESRIQYNNAVKQSLIQIQRESDDIYRPIPKATQCQICRVKITDYNKHIEQKQHKLNAKNSYGQRLINEQVEEMQILACEEFKYIEQITQVNKILNNSKKMIKSLLSHMKNIRR